MPVGYLLAGRTSQNPLRRVPNFVEFYKGEVHADMKVCIAPPQSARCSRRGMPTASGIMFLMYRFGRLVALVYIRQPQQHWGGAKRKDRRMEDGGTAAVLYERIVRGVGRVHTPPL
jgi:hypothetical protein